MRTKVPKSMRKCNSFFVCNSAIKPFNSQRYALLTKSTHSRDASKPHFFPNFQQGLTDKFRLRLKDVSTLLDVLVKTPADA